MQLLHSVETKEKKTTPCGVNLTRSQVFCRAPQVLHSIHYCSVGRRDVPVSVEGFLQVSPQIVSWQGISCTVPQGRSGQQRKILHSISGVAAVTGEDEQLIPCLFAVLGPSGAGKTTFMDILSGRKRDPGKIGKTTFMKIRLSCKPYLWTSCLAAKETQVSLAKQPSWTSCLAANKTQIRLAKQPSWTFCWAASETQVRSANALFMDILSGRTRDTGKIGKSTFMDILSGRKQDSGKIGNITFMEILSGRKHHPGEIGKATHMDYLGWQCHLHGHPVWPLLRFVLD